MKNLTFLLFKYLNDIQISHLNNQFPFTGKKTRLNTHIIYFLFLSRIDKNRISYKIS